MIDKLKVIDLTDEQLNKLEISTILDFLVTDRYMKITPKTKINLVLDHIAKRLQNSPKKKIEGVFEICINKLRWNNNISNKKVNEVLDLLFNLINFNNYNIIIDLLYTNDDEILITKIFNKIYELFQNVSNLTAFHVLKFRDFIWVRMFLHRKYADISIKITYRFLELLNLKTKAPNIIRYVFSIFEEIFCNIKSKNIRKSICDYIIDKKLTNLYMYLLMYDRLNNDLTKDIYKKLALKIIRNKNIYNVEFLNFIKHKKMPLECIDGFSNQNKFKVISHLIHNTSENFYPFDRFIENRELGIIGFDVMMNNHTSFEYILKLNEEKYKKDPFTKKNK